MDGAVVGELLEERAAQLLSGQLAGNGDVGVAVGDDDGGLAAVDNVAHVFEAELHVAAGFGAVERTQHVGIELHLAAFVEAHLLEELLGVVDELCFLADGLCPKTDLVLFGIADAGGQEVDFHECGHGHQHGDDQEYPFCLFHILIMSARTPGHSKRMVLAGWMLEI